MPNLRYPKFVPTFNLSVLSLMGKASDYVIFLIIADHSTLMGTHPITNIGFDVDLPLPGQPAFLRMCDVSAMFYVVMLIWTLD